MATAKGWVLAMLTSIIIARPLRIHRRTHTESEEPLVRCSWQGTRMGVLDSKRRHEPTDHAIAVAPASHTHGLQSSIQRKTHGSERNPTELRGGAYRRRLVCMRETPCAFVGCKSLSGSSAFPTNPCKEGGDAGVQHGCCGRAQNRCSSSPLDLHIAALNPHPTFCLAVMTWPPG